MPLRSPEEPSSSYGSSTHGIASSLILNDDDTQGKMTPAMVVERLNRYIVGQGDAKKAVAVAYRNRWRRHRVKPETMQAEIQPKNILMIGPTGCGKTEIARRLAKLADAPFVKVEATKFTEVGYHGRDVDTIIKDLVENAITLVRQKLRERASGIIRAQVEQKLLRLIVASEQAAAAAGLASAQAAAAAAAASSVVSPPTTGSPSPFGAAGSTVGQQTPEEQLRALSPEVLAERLRNRELENVVVEVEVPPSSKAQQGGGFDLGNLGGQSMGQAASVVINIEKLMTGGVQRKDKRKMTVAEARSLLEEAEAERMFPTEVIVKEAVRLAENDGIVFIDEIDKIVAGRDAAWRGGDPSSVGVQRDLLPIIEGSTVQTKHGNLNTDHILFICSGAFHSAKPSDLMAELQGRLPIRVELKALDRTDFYRILTEPHFNLIKQQQMLLAAEGLDLHFTDAAIHEIAGIAEDLNRSLENIGARRLHTVLERIVEPLSFGAPELVAQARSEGKERYLAVVDKEQVVERLAPLLKKQDLSKFII